MRGQLLLVLAACGALQPPPPLPRRALLRGAAGTLAVAPLAAAAVPVRRFGAGRQSPNAIADEQTMLVWTPRAEVGSRGADSEGYSGYAYPQRFVTYLARVLLNYDKGSAEWWAAQGASLCRLKRLVRIRTLL